MSATEDSSAEALPDREILATRAFNTPRELVFHAWSGPNHLARWWGRRASRTRFTSST